MLRITEIAGSSSAVALKLEGQIIAEWVEELDRQCRTALAHYASVYIDFEEVTLVDRRGAAMLRALRGDRLRFVNCPPLISAVINGDRG